MKRIVLLAAWASLAMVASLAAQADDSTLVVYDVQLSNFGGNAFVVSWRTSRPAYENEVIYGLSPSEMTSKKTDSMNAPSLLHYVQLTTTDIQYIDTAYYYKVVSDGIAGANGSEGYDSVMTTQQQLVPLGATLQGTVVNAENGTPLKNAIVYSFYRWTGPAGTDSTQWYAALTNEDGRFNVNLANYRRYNGNATPYYPGATWLHLKVCGQSQETVTDSVLLTFPVNDVGQFQVLDTYEITDTSVQTGDVDGNSEINIFDVLDLLKVIGKKITPDARMLAASDLDDNGKVDIFDLLELLRKMKPVQSISI